MSEENHIYEYYNRISSGSIVAGRWIKLVYEYLVRGIENGTFIYDAEQADKAIEWIETHCFHTEGPLAPGALKLELWQKALYSAMFGIFDSNGNRQFREVVFVVGRKNGKTLLVSAAGNYVFRVAGGYGAKVFCIAPKLEQADLAYSSIWQMITLDPEWQMQKEIASEKDMHNKKVNDDSMLARHRQSDLAIPGTNSIVKKIAFSAKKSDGFNPSLCICDEVAAWEGDSGLKQYEVMKSGMGARPDGLLVSCSTAGYINDGIYDELLKRSTRFLLGDSKETRLLPILYMIDDIEKWSDLEELKKANPNLGISVSEDYMREEIAIAEGSLSKRGEFITKYCNIKQNSSQAWLSTKTVETSFGDLYSVEDFRDSYCVCGVDLSRTTDLSSCCAVIEKNGKLYVFSHFFMPTNRLEDATAEDGVPYEIYSKQGFLTLSGENFVDYKDCAAWIKSLVTDYSIYPLKIGYDRYSAQYLVEDLKSFGFHLDDVHQGYNLTPVIRELEGLMKDGVVRIGKNNLLKAHLLNTALKSDAETQRIKPVKLGKRTRIDGTSALLDAMTVRQKYYAEIGEQLKNEE